MGFFDLFKKPPVLQDDLFGPLRFIAHKDHSKSYFEGKAYFQPTGNETDISITADKEGPSEAQRQFFLSLQSDFQRYIEKIQPLIEGEFRNWQEDFAIKDFNTEFDLVFLSIPSFDGSAPVWEMAFTTIHDRDHHITIDFIGEEPNGILIDG